MYVDGQREIFEGVVIITSRSGAAEQQFHTDDNMRRLLSQDAVAEYLPN